MGVPARPARRGSTAVFRSTPTVRIGMPSNDHSLSLKNPASFVRCRKTLGLPPLGMFLVRMVGHSVALFSDTRFILPS